MKKTFFLSLALAGIGLGAGFLNGLLGAGGGGFLLVYCPYNVRHQVARRLEAAGGQLMAAAAEIRPMLASAGIVSLDIRIA